MLRAGGVAALLTSVAAQGSAPSFTGTATIAGPVTGTVVVPELASAPKSIAVYWAFDKEGKNLSDAPFASKDYSIVNRRTCGDTGSVPGQRRLEPAGGGDVADPKIVNGENAGICKLKWQVTLQQDGFHFCGGTILSPKWVMSAAHCKWEDGDLNTITVVAGDYNLDTRESHQVTRKIKQVKVFPNYNDATTSGDFMLLELAEDLPFGDCIGAACLPSAAAAPGTDCLISGWGALKSEGESPVILQVATVKIVSNSDCEKNSGGEYVIDKFMICAQGGSAQTGIKDACQGDSGGPLVCKDSSGKYALQGATSFGNGCAQPEFAGVYARIVAVLDWIKTTTGLEPGDGEKASTVPISGATPPEGATGLAVFAVAADGKRTPLGVIALAAAAATTTTTTTTTKPTPTVTTPTQISGCWRPFLSWAFFAFPVAAHLWATVC